MAQEAGAQWLRFGLRWRLVEPSPGLFDWSRPDSIVATARRAGLKILAIVWSTPPWASSAPDAVLSDSIIPCKTPVYAGYPPAVAEEWETFLATAVQRYRGSVAAWEIWNEPDLIAARPKAGCTAGTWCGSAASYAELVSRSARVIRQNDPGALVVLAGFAFIKGSDPFIDEVLRDLNSEGGKPFDVANFHYYGDPEAAGEAVSRFRQHFTDAGLEEVPIWITETGLPSSAGLQEQSAYLSSVVRSSRAAGASKVFWYQLIDPPTSKKCMSASASYDRGLLTFQLQPKPAWSALRQATATEGNKPRRVGWRSQ